MPQKQLMNTLLTPKSGNLEIQIKSNREVYLDLAKFFAMIMMVAGHTFFELANPAFYDFKLFPWDWWNFARGKTAPTFLFLSGAVHVFANFKNNSTGLSSSVFQNRITMALLLLVIGYTLNSPINSFSEIFNISELRLNNFFQVNILHIFGIGLFILALVYKYSKSDQTVLQMSIFLATIVIIISPFLVNADLHFLPKIISNYFNYQNGSIFTITPYISYIFLGTVFGILLRRKLLEQRQLMIIDNEALSKSKFRLGLSILIAALLLIVLGIAITKTFIAFGFSIDLRSDIGIVVRNSGIILLIIFVARLIKVNNQKLVWLISTLSKRAIFIYIIHLFIIYGIGNISGLKHYYSKLFEPQSAFMMSILVIISSIMITLLLDKLIKYKIFVRISIGILVIYSIIFLLQ